MAKDKLDDASYAAIRNMEFGSMGMVHNPHALGGMDEPHTDFGMLGSPVVVYQPPGGGPTPGTGGGLVFINVTY